MCLSFVLFGAHYWIWAPEVRGSGHEAFSRVKSLGFDGVEIPVLKLNALNVRAVRESLDSVGLTPLITAAGLPETDLVAAGR